MLTITKGHETPLIQLHAAPANQNWLFINAVFHLHPYDKRLSGRHFQAPSIPGNMQINLTKDHAGRGFSADRLARIDGAIPECTANMPSPSR
jgi:hypothetical protein